MAYWIISDTHFNHGKLEQWGGRSGDWQDQLWAGINAIPVGDTLIHLGDICIGKDEEVHQKIGNMTMKVRKILVRGNHDHKGLGWYQDRWDFVCDAFALETMGERILFSHRPRNPDADNYTRNIHGHTHGNMHRSEEYAAFYRPGFHIDASPEIVGFKPMRLAPLLKTSK